MFDNYLKIKPAFSEANQTSFPLNVSICATLANSFSIKHVLSTCIERMQVRLKPLSYFIYIFNASFTGHQKTFMNQKIFVIS